MRSQAAAAAKRAEEERAAAALVENIATRGRSLGFNLVATNQSLVGIPRLMLTNFRLRCAVGEVDAVDLAQLSLGAPLTAQKSAAGSQLKPPDGFRKAIWIEPYQRPTPFWFAVGAESNQAISERSLERLP